MQVRGYSTTRLGLFLAGAAVLESVIWLGAPLLLRNTGKVAFLAVAALLVYIALLLPIVFSFVVSNGILVGGAVYYRGAWVFSVLSAAITVIALTSQRVTLTLAVLEAAAIFVFACYVFFSYYAACHAEKVEYAEEQKAGALDRLKQKAANLRDDMDETAADDALKAEVKKLTESIRFLSPSDDPRAQRLEDRLLEKLAALDLNNDAASQLEELELLLQQRKTIY